MRLDGLQVHAVTFPPKVVVDTDGVPSEFLLARAKEAQIKGAHGRVDR